MLFKKYRLPTHDHQLVAGIAISVFLIISLFYFWQRSVTNSGLIEFEDIPSRQVSFTVDINSAPWPEFANLPGIGEKLAQQIVSYRDQHGPFDSVSQLIKISGIGPSKLEKIKPYVAVITSPRGLEVGKDEQF
jgi:competence protein ComEA